MRWTCPLFFAVMLVLAVPGWLTAAEGAGSSAAASKLHCVVALADQADLPPQEAGVILDIPVHEGQHVAKGDLLLQLDDSKVQKELLVAKSKQEAAEAKHRAADINVKYARAAKEVADQEYKVNKEANDKMAGSVPKVRMTELLLKCVETSLAIEKADSDKEVAEDEAKVAAAEVAAAEVMIQRHKVLSPLTGEVDTVRAHKGEAVQPTQAVIRVIKLDSVWVEAREVPAGRFTRSELDGRDVMVDFMITRGAKQSLPGKITYVRSITDSGTDVYGTYMVRAEVKNAKLPHDQWLLHPGMQAEMDLQLDKSPLESSARQ